MKMKKTKTKNKPKPDPAAHPEFEQNPIRTLHLTDSTFHQQSHCSFIVQMFQMNVSKQSADPQQRDDITLSSVVIITGFESSWRKPRNAEVSQMGWETLLKGGSEFTDRHAAAFTGVYSQCAESGSALTNKNKDRPDCAEKISYKFPS